MNPVTSQFMEMLVGGAMAFTAYQIGVDARKGHGADVRNGAILAVVGTIISFAIGIPLAWFLLPKSEAHLWPAISAALSATDPVAVSALMLVLARASHRAKKLGVVLETESLFNDPIALVIFLITLGDVTGAIDGLILGLELAAVIVALSYVALRWRGRRFSTWVRVIATIVALLYGAQHHAALITLSVAANVVAGLLEAPYHHESHARIDATLFWSGTIALVFTVGAAFLILLPAALASLPIAITGGVYMVAVRLLARTFGIGFKFQTWLALAIGGSGAVGVVAIATARFMEDGHPIAAGLLAGAALTSLMVFIPPTVAIFRRMVDPGNGNSSGDALAA
jgi:NhaP-type Na+/H+ or K+/H+ antiporter